MRYLSNALPLLHPLGGHRSCGRADRHPPCAAVALEQFVGFFGPSAAGPVALEAVAGGVFPGVEKGLHRAPAGLDAVGALKQDVVADHAVVDQGLITGARLSLKKIQVAKINLEAADRTSR